MKLFTFIIALGTLPGSVWAGSDRELEEAQARVARAYQMHFQQAGMPGSEAALSKSMGALNGLVNDRRKEGENKPFGKVFESDGKVTNNTGRGGFSNGAKLLGSAAADSSTRAPSSVGSRSKGPTRMGRALHGPAQEEYVLDGSKVKKEISFGSKKD